MYKLFRDFKYIYICASSGSFAPYMDCQKPFLKFEKSLYCFEILFNQTLIKSLGGTKIYIKNCWVRLLSNYNIKYIGTIYTRLTSIPRFALREKVTLRLLKLLFMRVDVVEWSRELDVRLSEWCCSVSMVWVQIPSMEEQKIDSSKI